MRNEWPVIVGGCHRSGTSLVRRILDAHTRMYCGPEIKFFIDFYDAYIDDPVRFGRFIPSARAMLAEDELLDVLGAAFIRMHEMAAQQHGKARWADKNPENVLYLDQWHRLLGKDWLFLHVVRNPLDTLASIKEIRFSSVIPKSLDDRIQFYLRYLQAGLAFSIHHPDRYHRIIYEELVTDPRGVLSDLMAWLGEAVETPQLAFNDRPHQTGVEDPKVGATRAVHGRSMGRWPDLLTLEEASQIIRDCGNLWGTVDQNNAFPLCEAEQLMQQPSARFGWTAAGSSSQSEAWKRDVREAVEQISDVVSSGETFILVDDDQWATPQHIAGRHRLPFLERDGRYWGKPVDNDTAIRELERLRQAGARYIVFGRPSFWWLWHYQGLNDHLCSNYRRVLENERLVVFDLMDRANTRCEPAGIP